MTENKPILSIIIVNYNTKDVLRDCLNSIVSSKFNFPFEVFVIDNASDESISSLSEEFASFHFIQNASNFGFAFANNVGIAKAAGKYVLLLNPDTIVNSDSLQPMIKYLDEHTDVGIVGCKIFDSCGGIEHSTHSFPTLLKEFIHANEFFKIFVSYNSFIGTLIKRYFKLKSTESYWNHDSIREVDHVTGACMMVKKEAIDKVGLLDEAFFLYNEEVEWSYRMKQVGYKSVFLPDSSIIHLFGQSTKQQVQKQVVNRLLVERYRGMFYFFKKHFGPLKLFVLRVIVAEGFALRLLVRFFYISGWFTNKHELLSEIRYIRQIIALTFSTDFDCRLHV